MDNINYWDGVYKQYKAYLIAFAFRMTGSLAEAEEIVQDTFIECNSYHPDEISNHKSWLTKICSNKAINHIKSAYKRREVYPGVWLPDEIPSGLESWDNIREQSESLTTSFLILLEKLTPEQRAVFLLKEVFAYSFEEIASFLEKDVANCRKIAQRARDFISKNKVRFDSPPANAMQLIHEFFNCAKNGDREGLKRLLSSKPELLGDGGGKVSAAGHINEMDAVLDFLINIGKTDVFYSNIFKLEYRYVSERPGLIISRKDGNAWAFDTIMSFEFSSQKIARIFAQRNPDKLKYLISRFPSRD